MRRSITVPAIKTLVQSFDTARFQQDHPGDLATDIAQARTEALFALLFGRTIVVPAGQVADSPAFMKLFAEIINAQSKTRQKLYGLSTYRPFVLALESGLQNYDDFVRSYKETVAPLVNIDAQARDRQLTKSAQLEIMRKAYLDRDYALLDRGLPGYGHFANLVAEEFGEGAQSGARPIIANQQRIFTKKTDGFGFAMRGLLDAVSRKDAHAELLDQLREATDAILSDISLSQAGAVDTPQFRGSWYARSGRFGDAWEIARIWLDHFLYREFSVRYDVQVPSFFLQEVVADQFPLEVILAFAGDSVIEDLIERRKFDAPAISAATEKVDWETLWDMVADPKFQNSICLLNAALDAALLEEQVILESGRTKFADDLSAFDQWANRAREIRESKTREAINGHIDRMLSNLRDYLVTNAAGRIYVSLKRAPRAIIDHPMFKIFGKGSAEGVRNTASKGLGDAVKDEIKHYLAGPSVVESVAANASIIASLSGGITASTAVTGLKYTADWILRPKTVFGISESELRNQADRMNFWLGAARYA